MDSEEEASPADQESKESFDQVAESLRASSSELETGSPMHTVAFTGCLILSLLVTIFVGRHSVITESQQLALFILFFAATLWVSDAIPAFATGILVIALQIMLLGDPFGPYTQDDKAWEGFVGVLGHPLVWLFFGGFVLAAGMARSGLDRWFAVHLLQRLGTKPKFVLLGVMCISFVLSMFMSNTATTAMMLAMMLPLINDFPRGDKFANGMLLGIAAAANVGGMGSLIGTPPNAIAVGGLRDVGIKVDFVEWIVLGFPPAVILLALSWFLILWFYPTSLKEIKLPNWDLSNGTDHAVGAGKGSGASKGGRNWRRTVVSFTLVLTVAMWLTTSLHGIPTAAVSLVPIVILTATGVLGAKEIRSLNYDVLFLLAGGLALGKMVESTELSTWIVERIPVENLGVVGLALVLSFITLILSNFMSHTAAANILVPIGITMASGFEMSIAIPIALSASAAMMLPIATPPNALVFAEGKLTTMEFFRIGIILGVVTPLLAVGWTTIILPLMS